MTHSARVADADALPIRRREAGDLPACVRALAAVHTADHYPLVWPDDPTHWLQPRNLLDAWVAVRGDAIVGHVALCGPEDADVAHLWSAAAGVPRTQFVEVAKLFVAPMGRGRGLGAALLASAAAEATARGLVPALEVLDHDLAARTLYERLGWRHVGSVSASWALADGSSPLLHAYLAPR